MAALAGLRPLHQQPRVLCACAPGEAHEIALMLLALDVGIENLSTLYLGADVPVEAIAHAAAGSRCRVVALSCTIRFPRESLLDLRQRLDRLPRRVTLMVGGPAVASHAEWCAQHGLVCLPLDPEEASARVIEAVRRR
jgi:methanogenic corrinoid protein MtbC1